VRAQSQAGTSVVIPPGTRPLQMKVRRLPDSVELVIEGVGTAPQLQQSVSASGWQGRLTTSTLSVLRRGPQRLSLPEAGLQSIDIDGAGTAFRLAVTPVAGFQVNRPLVSADGVNLIISFPAPVQPSLQTLRPNLREPGRVAQPVYAPPLQPRAVAPPVGDMAVGTMMIANPSYVNVSGPSVTMTLKNAPAKDVLMALSRLGGYGFVYVDESTAGAQPATSEVAQARPISIAFRNENYGRAINSALMAAGIQGKREGNTIFAGPKVLGKSFGAQLSKVYRLNQVSSNSAADYLANLGATVTKTNVITTAVTQGVAQNQAVQGGPNSATTVGGTQTSVEAYGASTGPLVGLQATSDSRLSTITLVGNPSLVSVAEQYLKQLDLRQRQVALSVKILDVTLDNDKQIDNSFAFRYGNNFIVNDSGQLLGAFGSNLPATSDDFDNSVQVNTDSRSSSSGSSSNSSSNSFSSSGESTSFTIDDNGTLSRSDINNITGLLDQRQISTTTNTSPSSTTITVLDQLTGNRVQEIQDLIRRSTGLNVSTSRNFSSDSSRGRSSFSDSSSSSSSDYLGTTRRNPGMMYPRDNFYNFVRATIESRSTKILASPTLILTENPEEIRTGEDQSAANIQALGSTGSSTASGDLATIGRTKANEAFVTVGEQVITNYEVTSGTQGNGNSCQPEFGISGLTFGARVSKIDDNGFVTFSMSPAISATVREADVPGCGPIDILAVRRLDTGSARVRDGQTLILTGVISDADNQIVQKWPVLGDLPIVGQFFRQSGSNRSKRELVILVTPRIIDDNEGGTFGYGYRPGTEDARRFMGGSSN
jgi:type IV pilus assembly protein PilQ